MIYKIVDITDNKYRLIDKNGETFEHSFQFFDLPKKPDIGDIIELKELLFNESFEEYDNIYLFGPLNQQFGRDKNHIKETDLITLNINGEMFYLKRFFG